MRHTDFLKWLFVAALGLLMASTATAADATRQQPTNFVFFLVDDLGWMDTGCYGNRFFETPNVDRLASQGMRFTQAYAACALCSPTRASIMTGQYPARLHITNWIPGHVRPHAKLLHPAWQKHLPLEAVTIAEKLKAAGYATAAVGKWHLGGEGFMPENQGFDVNIAGHHLSLGGGIPAQGRYFAPYKNPQLRDGPDGEYLTDRLTDEAVKWLEASKDRPFFLYLAHFAVHVPIQAKEEIAAKYQAKLKRSEQATGANTAYAAMIESVDQSLGRVMDKLTELRVAERTVIIFTSDNGGLGGVTSNAPLRAGKGTPYEGGIRAPLIIKWPGVVRPGTVCNQPVISTDFFPTMLDMAGLPLASEQHKDGRSLAPLLKQQGDLDRETLFWHFPHYHASPPYGIVRQGEWKLIEFYEDGKRELYNLKDDLSEKRDLAQAEPKRAEELLARLRQWRADVGAQMPTPNPNFDAGKAKQQQVDGQTD